MSKTTYQLFFDYPSTARIRIKKENCLENPQYPCVYMIRTEKLSFLVPKTAVIIQEKHVRIPLQLYRTALDAFYQSIRN